MTKQELCQKAQDMLKMAYIPYSKFPVGAALECDDGTVYTGCNIENAAYGPSVCAERVAVFKAVSEGRRRFVRLAVAADTRDFCSPCGVCRQVLHEFAPDLEVIMVNRDGETRTVTLPELLPYSFGSSTLADQAGV